MGFAVTASHLVFALALLSAGTFAASAYWRINDDVEDARRVQAERAADVAHTTLAFEGTPQYVPGAKRVTFEVKNDGTTVLQMSAFAFLVDGVWRNTDLAGGYPRVFGESGSDYLLPGETMEVRIENVDQSPTNLAAIAENGVGAYWSS